MALVLGTLIFLHTELMRQLHIDDVRDLMCIQNTSLTPEAAADLLAEQFPDEPRGWILEQTRLVAEVRSISAQASGGPRLKPANPRTAI